VAERGIPPSELSDDDLRREVDHLRANDVTAS
jgi:predicted HTH domain antitoxin